MAEVKNKAQLITYPDSIGGNLAGLADAIDEHFPGVFAGGIHILPPFPSSGDRGFSPITYQEIDPRHGSWDDIARLGKKHDILLDVMVNHVSSQSPMFRDYLENGDEAEWADLFIPLTKFWPDGEPVAADIEKIFLRRRHPWSTYPVGKDQVPTRLWTTFGRKEQSDQIDVDWRSPQFKCMVEQTLSTFAEQGVRIIRLDAVGYVVKKLGTSCFFVEPEIWELLGYLRDLAARYSIALLPEVHGKPWLQAAIADHGYWGYDFILPYRVVEALILGKTAKLREYLVARPPHLFTTLDCHDGVPVKPDLDGAYDPADVRTVRDTCLARGGNLSLVFAPAHRDADGFDVHQIRGTIHALLGSNDDATVAARAIQLFAPGVPQIYYVGLLAGENDQPRGEQTGDGREINRHNYTAEEVAEAVKKPVVQRLVRLIRIRNEHPAFNGSFEVLPSDDDEIKLEWRCDAHRCRLEIDVASMVSTITMTEDDMTLITSSL